MPRAGAELFPMPDQFDFDPIAVVAGSKPLGRVWFGDVCERDFVAVVELTGNADEVFRRYVAATLPNGGTERRARVDGLDLTAVSDGYWTASMISGKELRRPLVAIDWCG